MIMQKKNYFVFMCIKELCSSPIKLKSVSDSQKYLMEYSKIL